MEFILLFMFLFSSLSFSFKLNYFLLMLLSLEMMVLFLFVLMFNMLSFLNDYYYLLIYLIMSVCESVLGLSILVSLIRCEGSDYLYFYNLI
uniref:NADH dehydrogenase subunit 4L n=1 Tax=Mengenilla moldrzyki TaxID=1155016 RepID=J3RK27_MENMO|nr:NADH dehydrogenase subunit 4L [Mengenilla moldrzyki]AFC35468.1 NADH dehydrogenase subunit 4L [Mengenilla moldrzyki]